MTNYLDCVTGENIGLMDDARNNAGTIAHVIGQWAAQSHYNTVGNFKCCGPNTSSCCDFTQVRGRRERQKTER